MKKIKFRSLTMRIWTTFTVMILIIILSISILYLSIFREYEENSRIQDLNVAHDVLLKDNKFDDSKNRFADLKNLKQSEHFIVNFDNSSRPKIIDVNKGPGPKDMGRGPEEEQNAKIWMTGFINGSSMYKKQIKATYDNMKYIVMISSVKSDDLGKVYLVSFIRDVYDNSLLYMVIVVGIVFIAIGFITAKIVANYIGAPLKQLESYTRKIARKEWTEPVKVNSDDEIGKLVTSMNQMQKELKHADEEERMFLQSISHDLKTPVMIIMSHAEAIKDGMYIDSLEDTAEIIKNEAIRLDKKIKQILYLNTLDYVLENDSENIDIDMEDFIINIVNRFKNVNSKIRWKLNTDKAIVNGDVEKIQVSIENILDNQLRYADEEICVSLKADNNFAVIEIYNDGPNIDDKHIDHIFDSLYKDKTGNFGLGLAICKKIVDFYNGDIKAVNRDKGVSFIIKYPIKAV